MTVSVAIGIGDDSAAGSALNDTSPRAWLLAARIVDPQIAIANPVCLAHAQRRAFDGRTIVRGTAYISDNNSIRDYGRQTECTSNITPIRDAVIAAR